MSETDTINYELPAFSATANQLVSEINAPEVKTPRVLELIEYEPIISAQILKIANSPLFGSSRPITTIGHAVVILGFRSVSQHAIAAATGELFNSEGGSCVATRKQTYTQSLAVATVGRAIAQQLNLGFPDEAFMCGVLHDIGKLVLLENEGERYESILQQHREFETPAAETEAFGVTHPTIGKCCGNAWGLPGAINLAIANHHHGIHEVSDPLSTAMVLANYYARKWEIGFKEDPDFVAIDALEQALPSEFVENLKAECVDQYDAIREICMS